MKTWLAIIGIILCGAIIAGGVIGEWWAFAIMIPAGAIAEWKWAER